MTAPVLCVNCGKARDRHAPYSEDCYLTGEAQWCDPTPIEDRTAEQIAAWLESMHSMVVDAEDADLVNNMAEQIRRGAWRKP